MGKRDDFARQLQPLSSDSASFPRLQEMLVANSNLPGPRGNLELAWAFGDAVGTMGAGDLLWDLLELWLRMTPEEAPTGDPREFLPFCALQALGSLHSNADYGRRRRIVDLLKISASDERWRTREGVAMAFQRIAEKDFQAVQDIFSGWIETATLLEQRAILAALAHPPVLNDAEHALFCLRVSERVLSSLAALDGKSRRTEEYRVLRQGLEYALSVFVEPLPEQGFAFLRRWAAEKDPDLQRIVRSNLGKARLAKKHPGQVAEVLALL